jgi:hypothetical protein
MIARAHPLLLFLLAACGANGSSRSGVSVTDSAGVRIVTSTRPVWAAGQEWRLGAAPALTIGEQEGAPGQEFTRIRRTFTLPDGRIVAVNQSRPPEIRLFDAQGQYQSTIGKTGEGPGEFRYVWDAWFAPPDTIIVFDAGLSRMTYFDLAGTPARMVTFEQRGSAGIASLPFARFADGSFLLRRNRFIDASVTGNGRTVVPSLRGSADGTVLDTLGMFPDADYVTVPDVGTTLPRFARFAVYYVHGNSYWRGMGDDFTVDEYDVSGRHLRSLRRTWTPRPATDELVERLHAHALAAVTEQRARDFVERDYTNTPRLETLPAYGPQWLVDGEDNLWVQDYVTVVDSVTGWTVFDREGAWLGVLHWPTAFRPEEIGADYVLGVYRNQDDVESVRRYPLIKPR